MGKLPALGGAQRLKADQGAATVQLRILQTSKEHPTMQAKLDLQMSQASRTLSRTFAFNSGQSCRGFKTLRVL